MTRRGRKAVGATEIGQTWSFRGSKSRNKVSVGEPAEGSLQIQRLFRDLVELFRRRRRYRGGGPRGSLRLREPTRACPSQRRSLVATGDQETRLLVPNNTPEFVAHT